MEYSVSVYVGRSRNWIGDWEATYPIPPMIGDHITVKGVGRAKVIERGIREDHVHLSAALV